MVNGTSKQAQIKSRVSMGASGSKSGCKEWLEKVAAKWASEPRFYRPGMFQEIIGFGNHDVEPNPPRVSRARQICTQIIYRSRSAGFPVKMVSAKRRPSRPAETIPPA